MGGSPSAVNTVIVGGGIAGVTLAHELACSGASVTLFEREELGSGATGGSMGGVRQQFGTATEVELSKRALTFWKTFGDRFGEPFVFHRDGYLLVTSDPDQMTRLADGARLQRDLGAGPVEVLDQRGLHDLVPWLTVDDLAGGTWTPDDGRISPMEAIGTLSRAARREGAQIVRSSPVTGLHRARGGWEISTDSTVTTCSSVVVAAGVWTPALLAPFGIQLVIDASLTHCAFTGPALVGMRVPLTIDLDTGLGIERDIDGLVVSVFRHVPPRSYSVGDMLELFAELAAHRAPSLADVEVRASYSADADLTPDGHPYVGAVGDGLYVLAGFSGHGTMHGPIVAEALADHLLGRPESIDLSLYDPFRQTSSIQHSLTVTVPDESRAPGGR